MTIFRLFWNTLLKLFVLISICTVVGGFLLAPLPFLPIPFRGAILLFLALIALRTLSAHQQTALLSMPLPSPPPTTPPEQWNVIYLATIRALSSAIYAKDSPSHANTHRIEAYATAIAQRMRVNEETQIAVCMGSLLHDIGKLGVPDYILLKPAALDLQERETMKRHAMIGAAILAPVRFPWPVTEVIRHHHERWDGNGYPDHLIREEIPLGARILAVAEAYASLLEDRPFRNACSGAEAIDYIRRGSGSQFDPQVVAAFLETVATQGSTESEPESETLETNVPERYAARFIQRSATEFWALYQVSQALNTSLDIQAKFELLTNSITSLFIGSNCAFLIFQPHEASIWATREIDNADESSTFIGDIWIWSKTDRVMHHHTHTFTAESFYVKIAHSRRVYRGAYCEEGLLAMPSQTNCVPTQAQSTLVLPLTHLGEIMGVLQIAQTEANAFSEDDERLLALIAGHIETTLYQDILFDRTRSDAHTDALTGLYNMRYLSQAIRPLLHRMPYAESAIPFTLLYLDLDNFKPVNDHFGHHEGNTVLQTVARLFLQELRPQDLVVRQGGDEFLIVLSHTDAEAGQHVAERIRAAIKSCPLGLIHPTQGDMRLDVSIGSATYPHDGTTLEALMEVADHRMYRQKVSQKEQSGVYR